jgi:2'-5' RNA ligase
MIARDDEPESLRLFFAAWPPGRAALALRAWAVDAAQSVGGRVVPAENVHLTLAFLGDVAADRLPRAIEAARGLAGEPHELPIDEARYRTRSRLVWARPRRTPPALAALAAELHRALTDSSFALERRAFIAHVTLIRNARKPRALPPLPALAWRVEEFVLVRSTTFEEGSRYEILERFGLE